MKRMALFLLLIGLLAINGFSQTKTPVVVVNEFWNLAVKNDFETAKKRLDPVFFGEITFEQLKDDFQFISGNEFKELKLVSQKDVSGNVVSLTFESRGIDNRWILVKFYVVKSFQGWEIVKYEKFVPGVSLKNNIIALPRDPQYIPFSERSKTKPPVKHIPPLYNPKDNPVKFQPIIPKSN